MRKLASKARYVSACLLCCLLASSCSLDETIYSLANPDNTIKSSTDVDYALFGAYAQLNYPQLFQRDIRRMVTAYADDLTSVQGTAMGTYGSKVGNNSGFAPNFQVWATIYVCISNANAVLNYLEKLELSPAYEKQAAGEARFLRAFCYFLLVQMWGGVPIWDHVADGSSDFYLPRNTVDEVYASIFEDLRFAAESLNGRSATPLYRATKGAATGYLAKSYLTYANYLDLSGRGTEAIEHYRNAKDAADELLVSGEYQLVSDYGDLWDLAEERNNYSEVVFGIGFKRDPTNVTSAGEGSALPQDFLPNSLPNSTGSTSGRGGGAVKVHPWFIERYLAGDYVGDYRVEKSFLLTWIDHQNRRRYVYPLVPEGNGVTESQAYIHKYIDPDGLSNDGHENDLYLLRLSEIYLIKAEAENELNGPTESAFEAFNAVRQRARNADGNERATPADISVVDVPTKEDFRLKVFDERGLEFVGEFNRWFDLVRMRYRDTGKTMYEHQFGTFLPTVAPGLPTYAGGTWSQGRTEANNIVPFDAKYLLYPIPANEMATNPTMEQNKGW